MESNFSLMASLDELHSRKSSGYKRNTLCILGTGDFGKSLGMRLIKAGYPVIFGSRNPKNSALLPGGAEVFTHADALERSQIVFLAVHRENYGFLQPLSDLFDGKVLVDVSNNLKINQYRESNAVYLSQLIPKAIVVKGFNTVSAWALQSGSLDANSQVFVCGDDGEAKHMVMDIARSIGLTPLDQGSLLAANEVENYPLQLFPMWRLPFIITAGLTVLIYFYCVLIDLIYSYVIKGIERSYRLLISIPNRVFPTVSLILLGLVYLPGVVASFLQLYRSTKYKRFPNWLDRWMLCRKQLGLVALAFAFLHVFYTLIMPIRYSYRWQLTNRIAAEAKKNTTSLEMNKLSAWRADLYYAIGILGFFLFLLLGITSFPSIANSMNWREFRFVQSKLGHVTLLLCAGHAAVYGWDRFLKTSKYRWGLPPTFMLSLVIPCMVLTLKLILITPCVDRMVTRIRHGWERKPKSENDQV